MRRVAIEIVAATIARRQTVVEASSFPQVHDTGLTVAVGWAALTAVPRESIARLASQWKHICNY